MWRSMTSRSTRPPQQLGLRLLHRRRRARNPSHFTLGRVKSFTVPSASTRRTRARRPPRLSPRRHRSRRSDGTAERRPARRIAPAFARHCGSHARPRETQFMRRRGRSASRAVRCQQFVACVARRPRAATALALQPRLRLRRVLNPTRLIHRGHVNNKGRELLRARLEARHGSAEEALDRDAGQRSRLKQRPGRRNQALAPRTNCRRRPERDRPRTSLMLPQRRGNAPPALFQRGGARPNVGRIELRRNRASVSRVRRGGNGAPRQQPEHGRLMCLNNGR